LYRGEKLSPPFFLSRCLCASFSVLLFSNGRCSGIPFFLVLMVDRLSPRDCKFSWSILSLGPWSLQLPSPMLWFLRLSSDFFCLHRSCVARSLSLVSQPLSPFGQPMPVPCPDEDPYSSLILFALLSLLRVAFPAQGHFSRLSLDDSSPETDSDSRYS